MNDMLIRIYGDSISLPRYTQGIDLLDTWPEKLRKMFEEYSGGNVSIFNRSLGGGSIKEIFKIYSRDAGYFDGSNSTVIFFLGIVDCAPRPIPKWTRMLVGKLPWARRQMIVKFLHNNRSRIQKIKYYNITSKQKFKSLYEKMVELAGAQGNQVLLVSIGPVSDNMKRHSFGLEKEINAYNNIIKNICASHDNAKMIAIQDNLLYKEYCSKYQDSEIFLNDAHHYTNLGNEMVAKIIFRALINMCNNNEKKGRCYE